MTVERVIPDAVVTDELITITLHSQVSQFPQGIKPEDFYVQLMARYGGNEAKRFHFTIATSEQFDIATFTPRKLRDYLATTFQQVLDLPAVVQMYGRLVPKTEHGQLRGRLYDCVARRFDTANN